jgi:hypothetical protein
MKQTLKLLFGVVVAAGLVVPALAQNFPDVPEYHWAYEALKTLRDDGLLVGYPDGNYRGDRPMSRYEFAVAMNAAYQKLKYMMEGLDSRIDGIQSMIDDLMEKIGEPPDLSNYATKQDLQALKEQLDAFKSELDAMKKWKDDIDALKRLASTFEQDLASLGVDVEAFKKDLRSMEDRIRALEERKPAVDIHGDMYAIGIAGHSRDDRPGISWNGNHYGIDPWGNPTGIAKDLHGLHELGLNLSGVYGRDVNVEAEVVVSNLTDYEFGRMAIQFPRGATRKDEAYEDVYLHKLQADWETAWFGSPVNIRLGRIGHEVNPYILRRQDVDYYIDIDRWDDGNYYFDGAHIEFDWDAVEWEVYGGRIGSRGSVWWSLLNMRTGDLRTVFDGQATGRPGNDDYGLLNVDRLLGTELEIGLGNFGELGLTYNYFDGWDTTWPGTLAVAGFNFNRIAVWGANLDVDISDNFGLTGYLAQSDYYYNNHVQHDDDNWAVDGKLNFTSGDFSAFAGYRMIGPYFGAPGDWGRIGYWHSPADIEGFQGGVSFKASDDVTLYASGEMYTGTDRAKDAAGVVYGLTGDDKINRIQAGLGFQFAENWHLGLGWEGVFWDLEARTVPVSFAGGKVDEHYFTADLDYDLGKGTSWRFGYQICDYNNKTTDPWFNTPNSTYAEARGGLFFTQFSLEF